MSDQIKKETALINLKLIHIVLAILVIILGAGYKYFSSSPPTEVDPKSPTQVTHHHYNNVDGNISHADGNAQVSITDKRVTNNFEKEMSSKGGQPKTKSPQPKITIPSSPSTSPSKETLSKKYFNKKFTGDIAILGIKDEGQFSNLLENLLNNENYKTTTSFFRSSFLKNYQSDVWNEGIDIFENFQIQNNIKCACLIKEKLEIRNMKIASDNIFVEGNIEVKIINLNTGGSSSIIVPAGVPGFNKANAYENLQANFQNELKQQSSKFKLCKN